MNSDCKQQDMVPSSWIAPAILDRLSEHVPSIDIYEQADDVVIKAEIPGVRKEDVLIEIDGDTITISGEKKEEPRGYRGGFQRIERSFGSFIRQLHLPDGFKAVFAYATFSDGILEIRMARIMQPVDPSEQPPLDRP